MELEDVRQTICSIALIHPQSTFTIRNEVNGEKVLQTSLTPSVRDNFAALYSQEEAEALVEIPVIKMGKMSLKGFVGRVGTTNKAKQFVYVNRRVIKKSRIKKAVNESMRKSIVCKQKPPMFNKGE